MQSLVSVSLRFGLIAALALTIGSACRQADIYGEIDTRPEIQAITLDTLEFDPATCQPIFRWNGIAGADEYEVLLVVGEADIETSSADDEPDISLGSLADRFGEEPGISDPTEVSYSLRPIEDAALWGELALRDQSTNPIQWYLRVRNHWQEWFSNVTEIQFRPVDPPANVTVTRGCVDEAVLVTWDPVEDYDYDLRFNDGTGWTNIETVDENGNPDFDASWENPSYLIPAANLGQNQRFEVRSYFRGCFSGPALSERFNISDGAREPVFLSPVAPRCEDSADVTLRWGGGEGDDYEVQVSRDGYAMLDARVTVPIGVELDASTVVTLTEPGTYSWRVRAIAEFCTPPESNWVDGLDFQLRDPSIAPVVVTQPLTDYANEPDPVTFTIENEPDHTYLISLCNALGVCTAGNITQTDNGATIDVTKAAPHGEGVGWTFQIVSVRAGCTASAPVSTDPFDVTGCTLAPPTTVQPAETCQNPAQVNLTWFGGFGESYEIDLALDTNEDGQPDELDGVAEAGLIGINSGFTTTMAGPGVYHYRVRARSTACAQQVDDEWSSAVGTITVDSPTVEPDITTQPVDIDNDDDASITFVAEADHSYTLFLCDKNNTCLSDASADVDLTIAAGVGTGLWTSTSKITDTGYYFRVLARKTDCGPISEDSDPFAVLQCPPGIPSNLSEDHGSCLGTLTESVTLEWLNSSGRETYEVEIVKGVDDTAFTGTPTDVGLSTNELTTTVDVEDDYVWRVRGSSSACTPNAGPWSAWQTFRVSGATVPASFVTTPGDLNFSDDMVLEVTETPNHTYIFEICQGTACSTADITVTDLGNTLEAVRTGPHTISNDWTWRVTAARTGCLAAAPTVSAVFETLPCPVQAPTVLFPADTCGTNVSVPLFFFGGTGDTYDIELTDVDASTTQTFTGVQSGYTETLNPGDFEWRVRAVDNSCTPTTSGWSTTSTFTIVDPPTAPTVQNEYGLRGNPAAVAFEFSGEANHSSLDIEIRLGTLPSVLTQTPTRVNVTSGVVVELTPGTYQYAIRANGTSGCTGDWTTTKQIVVENPIDVAVGGGTPIEGYHPHLNLDTNGNAFISYHDLSASYFVARSTDGGETWPSANTTNVLNAFGIGSYPTRLGSFGNDVYLVMHNQNGANNTIASNSSANSGGAWGTAANVITANVTGHFLDMAVKANDSLYVCYDLASSQDLRFAKSTNGGTTFTGALSVDTGGQVGTYCDIAVDTTGNRVYIAYYDFTNGNLKFARSDNDGVTWPAGNIVTIDNSTNDVGRYASLAIDEGLGHVYVSYYDNSSGDLYFARSTNHGTTWSTPIAVDAGSADVGLYSTVMTAPVQKVYVAYYDYSNGDLKLARSDNRGASFAASARRAVVTASNVGLQAAAVVDPTDGVVHVAHVDFANTDLRYWIGS